MDKFLFGVLLATFYFGLIFLMVCPKEIKQYCFSVLAAGLVLLIITIRKTC